MKTFYVNFVCWIETGSFPNQLCRYSRVWKGMFTIISQPSVSANKDTSKLDTTICKSPAIQLMPQPIENIATAATNHAIFPVHDAKNADKCVQHSASRPLWSFRMIFFHLCNVIVCAELGWTVNGLTNVGNASFNVVGSGQDIYLVALVPMQCANGTVTYSFHSPVN